MNRSTGFQSQDLLHGRSQVAVAPQRDGDIHYVKGQRTHTLIGCVEGLAVALVEEGMPYQKVQRDLLTVLEEHDIPSGILLFARQNSSALSDEALDELASYAISVADAGSGKPEDVQNQLLDEFVQRQAQIMKVFKQEA